jgi:hypothetical protein
VVGDREYQGVRGASASPTALAPPSGVKPASGLEQSRSSTGASGELLAKLQKYSRSTMLTRDLRDALSAAFYALGGSDGTRA